MAFSGNAIRCGTTSELSLDVVEIGGRTLSTTKTQQYERSRDPPCFCMHTSAATVRERIFHNVHL